MKTLNVFAVVLVSATVATAAFAKGPGGGGMGGGGMVAARWPASNRNRRTSTATRLARDLAKGRKPVPRRVIRPATRLALRYRRVIAIASTHRVPG